MRSLADAALVWTARVASSAAASEPQWEQPVPGNETIRLSALCRLDRWPFCWWGPDGNPIPAPTETAMNRNSFNTPLWAAVDLTCQPENRQWRLPVVPEEDISHRNEEIYHQYFALPVEKNGDVYVGVPYGPWKQVGQIKMDESIVVEGKTYTLKPGAVFGARGYAAKF